MSDVSELGGMEKALQTGLAALKATLTEWVTCPSLVQMELFEFRG
jgi:hypothetical protein